MMTRFYRGKNWNQRTNKKFKVSVILGKMLAHERNLGDHSRYV